MGRRRAHSPTGGAAAVVDDLPISARVAWSYVAALLAGIGTALLVVLSNQTLAVIVCSGLGSTDDAIADCKLGFGIWTAVIGYVVCLLPAVLLLRLGWWIWVSMAALAGLLVSTDAVTQWWWWAAAALVPAVAALISAEWGAGRVFRRVQLGVLLLLVVAAGVLLWWWYTRT
ncbi:hypothetical protein [Propionicimonas sp.]|uniref:hypothetical protein n=1 Tax=Propionicimonas sp. TaxID=1955623 RepID=UPI0039E67D74